MKYVLSLQAQNKQGVLAKITGLLRRKCFQIDSLTVGRTEDKAISHFTIIILGEQKIEDQLLGQLNKIIEVLSVKVVNTKNAITREIVLAKLKVNNKTEKKIFIEIKSILHNKIEQNGNELILELIDTSEVLDKMLEKIKSIDIEIIKWRRSGVIVLEK
jgi:acetolactate synthase-1/3 small subunit